MNKFIYNDFTPLAAENAAAPASGSSAYQVSSNLLNIEERELINYASFDADGIALTDESLCFAEQGDSLGYISSAVSGANCSANVRIIITFSNGAYNTNGLTVHWYQNICTAATAKFYNQSGTLLDTVTMQSTELDAYFEKSVSGFNKIVIDVTATEKPKQFIKIKGFDLGKERKITEFASEINVYMEIAHDCADLPGNTCDFNAIIKDGEIPQKRQDLFLYDDDNTIGKFTVSDVTKISEDEFAISCNDDIVDIEDAPMEALDDDAYTVAEICDAIYTASGIKINPGNYAGMVVSGFLVENQNARIAAVMLSFAIGKYLSAAFSERPLFFAPTDNGKTIEPDQIIGDALYTKKDEPSEIELIKYDGSFDVVESTVSYTNADVPGGIVFKKSYSDFSMINNAASKLNELVPLALMTSEVEATIAWNGERIGEIVRIATKYDGIKQGIIKSMELSLAEDKIATIKIATR